MSITLDITDTMTKLPHCISSLAPESISFGCVKNKPNTEWLKTVILPLGDLGLGSLRHLCGQGLVDLEWSQPQCLSAPLASQPLRYAPGPALVVADIKLALMLLLPEQISRPVQI